MEVQTENKMGTMPVNKLLVNISLPMVISMLVQALYNIVDSIFVAQIDEYALTAVSLAFPLQNFMIAVAAGTGVGCNYLLFLLIGIFFSGIYFEMQTDIPEIIQYGRTYLLICTAASFGMFGQFCFERLLQSTGRTVCTMITQMSGAIINLIFDPVLIFGVFGQIVDMFMAFYYNRKKNREIRLSAALIRPDKSTLRQIYEVAVPAILMQSIGSVMTFAMNKILLAFTSTAAAVFGVYFKLQSFIFMPIFGMNNGLIPIVAYNYGAGYKDRIIKTMKSSMFAAVAIMFAGLLVAELIPDQLLLLFNASEQMLAIGVPALRILCLCYVFAGFSIVASGVFQGLGKSVYSLVLSVIRQLVILLPAAYLLSLTGELNAVWFSFPIAEIASVLVTIFYLRSIMKNLDHMLEGRK